MGRQIILQPNGVFFALWTTVSDEFIFDDCTAEEICHYLAQEAYNRAFYKSAKICEDLKLARSPIFNLLGLMKSVLSRLSF